MERIIEALFGLRKGERTLALLMALYHFLLLSTLYLLKPVRDSLFLIEQGPAELPFVFMLSTVAVIPVAALYARGGRSLPLARLIDGVSFILVANLLVLRWVVTLEAAWAYYLLYVWVSIYAVLITSQFWLLANAVFDVAESKRIFVLLSAGAILGSVAGGELTGLLVDELGMRTDDLILLSAGLLAGTVILVNYIRQYSQQQEKEAVVSGREDPEPDPVLAGIWSTLSQSRHLLLIIGLIALAVTATTFVDYQFKTVAAQAHTSEPELTSFMGRFYGRVSLAALILQVVVAPRLLRVVGVGGALSVLPLGLLGGTIGMLAAPGLVAGTLLRGIDQSVKHSIDKTGRELLFVPVGLETKKRVKVFIDLFVDHGAQGFGGLLLLLLTLGLGLNVRQLSLVVLVLLGGWLLLAVLARNSYINQFRTMLQHPEEDEEKAEEETAMTFSEMVRSLRSRSRSQVLRALDRLERGGDKVPVGLLRRLLEHRSAEVRRKALRVLRRRSVPEQADVVAVHMEDSDPDVRLEAARYLYRHLDGDRRRLIQQGLEHPDVRVQAVVIGLIAKDGGPEERALLDKSTLKGLMEYDGEASEEGRLQVARVLSVLDWPERNDMLRRLMEDPSPRVAERAIKSAGQIGDRDLVPALLEHLKDDGEHRAEARRSLAAFGDRVLGTLYDYVTDPQVDLRVRLGIPSILAEERSQAAADVLLLASTRVSVPVWHEIARALSRLRRDGQALRFRRDAVDAAIEREARRYCAFGQVLHVRHTTNDPAAEGFPEERLRRARRRSLERLFRLLGLHHNREDIYNAYRGLTSSEASLRASAVEFVDNLLEWEKKRFILPLLNDPDGAAAARRGPVLFRLRITSWPGALAYLITSDDPRLVLVALESLDTVRNQAVRDAVRAASEHAESEVQEAARRLLKGEPATAAS